MNDKTPSIRFKGFTDDWEQRKLGELCNITTGKLDANAMIPDGKYDFYTSGIEVFKIDKAEFEGPAITVAGNGANVGYIHLADGKFNAYQRTYVLTDFLANRQFLNASIGIELPHKIYEEVRGSGIPYIVLNMLTDLVIQLPSIEEQFKVGAYFDNLDNLITLHQRKCEVLLNVKKSMLEKMFPKNGKKVPEIRFDGFTDDWEQRKLGNITVKIGSGKTPSGGKSTYVETGIPLIRSQNVNFDKVDFADIVFIDEATDESMANSRVYTNDVLLNITGASIGRSAVYKGLESANVNQHVCIIRPTEGYQPDFIQLNLSSDNGQKQIDASQAGGGREGLNFQEIGKMQFCFPSLNEQQCIGRYFNNLDHLITLHQRKLEKLQNLKKSMLEHMFL